MVFPTQHNTLLLQVSECKPASYCSDTSHVSTAFIPDLLITKNTTFLWTDQALTIHEVPETINENMQTTTTVRDSPTETKNCKRPIKSLINSLHNLHVSIPREPHKNLTNHIQLLQPLTKGTNVLFFSMTNTTSRIMRQQIVQQLLHILHQYSVERVFIQQMNEQEPFQTYAPAVPTNVLNILLDRQSQIIQFLIPNQTPPWKINTYSNLITHIRRPNISPHSLSTSPTSETPTGSRQETTNPPPIPPTFLSFDHGDHVHICFCSSIPQNTNRTIQRIAGWFQATNVGIAEIYTTVQRIRTIRKFVASPLWSLLLQYVRKWNEKIFSITQRIQHHEVFLHRN